MGTVYDPTYGSGSLLLKVGDEARAKFTLYGQEKEAAMSGEFSGGWLDENLWMLIVRT